MNHNPPTVPGLFLLYRNDFTIGRAVKAFVFGIIVSIGVRWATQPVASNLPPIDNSMDLMIAHWASLGGLALSGAAAIILIWRYLWIRKVFTQGSLIKGMVEDISVHAWTTDSDSTTNRTGVTRHSYYASILYQLQGEKRKVRIKLPSAGFVFNIVKGEETELMVLEESPGKPLIRSVYLNRL